MLRLIITALLLCAVNLSAQAVSKEVRELLDRDTAGSMSARADIAWRHFMGDELPQDRKLAWKLINEATAANEPHAYYRIFWFWVMDETKGTPNFRYAKASAAIVKAAEMGHPSACIELGLLYAEGEWDFPKNPVLAYKWIALGLDKKDVPAMRKYFSEIEAKLSKEQLTEAKKLAREFKGSALNLPKPVRSFNDTLKAANAGDAEAQNEVAISYQNGIHTEVDKTQAVLWFSKSAAQGNASGLSNLGYHYAYGLGVPADPVKGAQLTLQAALKGNEYAAQRLGEFYAKGTGVSRDRSKAYQWYLVAENLGHSSGSYLVDRLEAELTPEEIARGQRLATEVIEKLPAKTSARSKTSGTSSSFSSKYDETFTAAKEFRDSTLWLAAYFIIILAIFVSTSSSKSKVNKKP